MPEDFGASATAIFARAAGRGPKGDVASRVGQAASGLLISKQAHSLTAAPFTERMGYRRAAALMGSVGPEVDDPITLVIAGRARLGLGEPAAAAELFLRAQRTGGGLSDAALADLARALEQSGQYDKIIDLYRSGSRPPATSATLGAHVLVDYYLLDGTSRDFPGLERLAALKPMTIEGGCGGGATVDIAFIPQYRPLELQGTECTRAYLLAGRGDELLAGRTPDNLGSTYNKPCAPTELVGAMAAALSKDSRLRETWSPHGPDGATFGALTTLFRHLGQQDQALGWAERWVADAPQDGEARDNLGEVRFLRGDLAGAAKDFAAAAKLFEASPPDPVTFDEGGRGDLGAQWSRLRQAAALTQAGDLDGADRLMRDLVAGRSTSEDEDALLGVYVDDAAGTLALKAGRYQEAADHFGRSIAPQTTTLKRSEHYLTVFRGSQENNRALALAKLDQREAAQASARAALKFDPNNPVFLETLAFTLGDGDPVEAIAAYERALAEDPTLYSSWNNLGVLLGDAGHRERAEQAFRHAIGVNPQYAKGWFNLGSLLRDSWSPVDVFRGHGALGRAALLNSDMRGQAPGLSFDDEIYTTGLDLSKPLSPSWQFARAATLDAQPFALMALIAGIMRLLWALLYDELGGRIGEWAIRQREHAGRYAAWTRLRLPPVVAVVTTTLVLVWPILKDAAPTALEVLLVTAVLASLVAVSFASRWLVSRSAAAPRHFTSAPALAVGLAGMVVGVGFAPVPCLDDEAQPVSAKMRWAAPATLAVIVLVLLIETWRTEVPMLRLAALAGLTLVSSSMVPVRPLDGAYLHRKTWEIGIAVALVAVSAALTLGLI